MPEKFKIVHDRPGCIGCTSCANTSPKHWEMDEDAKSNLKESKRYEDGTEEKDIEDEELEINNEAAENCPVNVIHIIDKKGNKII